MSGSGNGALRQVTCVVGKGKLTAVNWAAVERFSPIVQPAVHQKLCCRHRGLVGAQEYAWIASYSVALHRVPPWRFERLQRDVSLLVRSLKPDLAGYVLAGHSSRAADIQRCREQQEHFGRVHKHAGSVEILKAD